MTGNDSKFASIYAHFAVRPSHVHHMTITPFSVRPSHINHMTTRPFSERLSHHIHHMTTRPFSVRPSHIHHLTIRPPIFQYALARSRTSFFLKMVDTINP